MQAARELASTKSSNQRENDMKLKINVIVGAVLLGVGAIGLVGATPIVGLTSPFLSVGTAAKPIDTHGVTQAPDGDWFNVRLTTDGPSNISFQEFAITANGHNGWHSHPGMVAVTVLTGTIQWYDENCKPTTYKAGDSWTEGSQPHYFRNIGEGTAQLTAIFVVAKGAAYRIDRSAPACAIGLGLE
jgi:quercetin dioxygenase-like cupin family protein